MYSSLFFRLNFIFLRTWTICARNGWKKEKTCRPQFDQRVFPERQIITFVVYHIIAESRSYFGWIDLHESVRWRTKEQHCMWNRNKRLLQDAQKEEAKKWCVDLFNLWLWIACSSNFDFLLTHSFSLASRVPWFKNIYAYYTGYSCVHLNWYGPAASASASPSFAMRWTKKKKFIRNRIAIKLCGWREEKKKDGHSDRTTVTTTTAYVCCTQTHKAKTVHADTILDQNS